VRVLFDYRAALRERTGVGEYAHQLAAAILKRSAEAGPRAGAVDLTLFSSSWKDRLDQAGDLRGAAFVDRRVPGRLLNFAWHRLGWPAVETLAGGPFDVVHSLHPLLMPSRDAARVVTIHDLNFLRHPERTRAEIRRDYPALARQHAHRADRIIVNSYCTAQDVAATFGIPIEEISVCRPGGPGWAARERTPERGYVLFLGTLEPRKNIGTLLDAYESLASRRSGLPELLLAGKVTAESAPWIERIGRAPLNRIVRARGYVSAADRRGLYEGAALLVQPSFDEGFGLPVLEAMTLGVPVVAANRGALPEVLGQTGLLVDPGSPEALASAIEQILDRPDEARRRAEAGVERARGFSWDETAAATLEAYEAAVRKREARRRRAA
jgi:glycosyltransferase involved in cell wall biosynthesis